MIITPQTDLVLLKCPLEVDQQNQLTFTNTTAQYNYFNSLPKLSVSSFTYQRKDDIIRFPAQVDEVRSYNYCMYRNSAYSNKWFYAFITEMLYANDNVTEIKLKTDVWQTWCFNITLKKSFVEREHVSDDTVGAHTLNEEINTGEYVINAVTNKTICAPDADFAYIVMAVTELPTNSNNQHIGPASLNNRVYNGVLQGCYLVLFEYNSAGVRTLSNFINWYDSHSKKDAITSIYAVPKNVYPSNYLIESTIVDPELGDVLWPISHTGATDMGTTTIVRNTNIDGYTPKNNKLFCYPYNYLMVTNNKGTNSIYHYEDFTNNATMQFKYNGVLTEGSDVKCYPVNYKKSTKNLAGYAYGVDMGKTPTFSWNNDMYLNWKAANSWEGVGNQTGVLGASYWNQPSGGNQASSQDILGYLGGIFEAGANLWGSWMNSIKNTVSGAGYKASLQPDQVNGQSMGELNYSIGRCGFTYYQMNVRYEVAVMIDNYLSMFGYRVNAMKNINISSRRYWNYIKCIQANITGDIPQDDMNEIKGYFNNGITFWHDATKYLDYSQNNTIV